MKNTKKRGTIEFIVFPDKRNERYVGVCLTFDIVEEGKDLKKLKKSIMEAAQLHLECVIKNNLSDDLLNRKAPKEYWDKYEEIKKITQHSRNVKTPRVTGQISQYLETYDNSIFLPAFA